MIAELTGHPARRRLGASQTGDAGHRRGATTVVQVANWADVARTCRPRGSRPRARPNAANAGDVVPRLHVGAVPWRPGVSVPDP